MPDLDRIEVRLTAQISDFQRAMQTAGKEVDSFAAKGQGASASVGNLSKATDTGAKSGSTYAEMLRQGYQLQEQLTKSQVGVIRNLENQIVAQRLSGRELAVYTALQRARTTADTEAGRVIAALAARHHEAANATKATSAVTQELHGRAVAAAGSLGTMGTALIALGPAGLAIGAVIATATLGFAAMVKAADELADRAGKMVDFAETTGLTTTQLQALQKAAAFVGIDAEKVGTGFERFTVQLEELRRGTGGLFDGLNRLNPALTRQLAETRSVGEAWDVFAKAMANANREQANAIARAGFGRTGIPFTRLAGATTEAGGLAGLEQSLGRVNTLTTEQLKLWDELKDKIDYNSKLAKQNIASIFTEDVLQLQLRMTENWVQFSQSAKDFSLSGDWRTFVRDISSSEFVTFLQKLPVLGAIGSGLKLWAGQTKPPFLEQDWTGSDLVSGGNVPTPRGRPQELDPRFNAAVLQKQIAAMGDAATAADKLRLAELQLSIASKDAGLSQEQHNRALAVLQQSSDLQQLQTRVGLMGVLASVEDKVAATANAVALARLKGANISAEEARNIVNLTRALAEEATVEGRMRDARENLFKSQVEQNIDRVLLRNGIPPESERGKAIADYMRMTELLRTMSDIGSEAVSGFAKDIANGVDGLDAALNVAKRLRDIFIDIAAKKLMAATLGSLFDTGATGLTQTAAATSAATILTTASATMAAEWITAATTVAGILTGAGAAGGAALEVGGAAAGVTTAAGGTTGGAALAAGGAAAGTAIWGPIAILMAALAAAAAATSWLSGQSERRAEERRRMEQTWSSVASASTRAELAGIDEDTRAGSIAAFEIRGRQQLLEAAKLGWQAYIAEESAQRQELARLNRDWDARELEAAEQQRQEQVRIAEEAARQVEEIARAVAARRQGFQNVAFDALNDMSTMEGQLAALAREREQAVAAEMAQEQGAGEALLDLQASFDARELQIRQQANQRVLDETKRAEEERLRALNQAAKTIVDYLAGLQTGASSPLSPAARLAAAQAQYGSQLALAQGGNADALNNITQFAEALRTAAQAFYGSSTGYQSIFNAITAQLLALPAVQGTTDPQVAALRDVVQAVHDARIAIGGAVADTTGAVNDNVSKTQDTTAAVTNTAAASDQLTIATNALLDSIKSFADYTLATAYAQNDILREIKLLNVTASQQLDLLNKQIASGRVSGLTSTTAFDRTYVLTNGVWLPVDVPRPAGSVTSAPSGAPGAVDNTMLVALNKIVFNTWAIASNTGQYLDFATTFQPFYGVFGGGGWVGGNQHSAGGTMINAERDEFVVRRSVALANSDWLPAFNQTGRVPSNDNGAVVSELRSMHMTIGRLLTRIADLEQQVRDGVDRNTGATLDQTETIKAEARQDRNNPQNKKAA